MCAGRPVFCRLSRQVSEIAGLASSGAIIENSFEN
jgi:hypothetical protein